VLHHFLNVLHTMITEHHVKVLTTAALCCVYTRTRRPDTCFPDEQLVSGYRYVDGQMLMDTS